MHPPLDVQLIAHPQAGLSGTARYTSELYRSLRASGMEVQLRFPSAAPLPGNFERNFKCLGFDLTAVLASFPLRVTLAPARLYHLTMQTLATLLRVQKFPAPVVVTVFDIIPYTEPNPLLGNRFKRSAEQRMYQFALQGLRRADALIAISAHTRAMLIDCLGFASSRVHTVYPSIDPAQFHPEEVPQEFWTQYGLNPQHRHILYVGSNDPRKNLKTLGRAFAQLKVHVPNARLVLVGSRPFLPEREQFTALCAESEIERDVVIFDQVNDAELVRFYNAAQVLVMPSLLEGFGLPVLEAMACGTPVVASNRTAVPEVVGESGLLMNPTNVDEMAEALTRVLMDSELRARLAAQGVARARTFSAERMARGMREVYRTLGAVA